VVVDMFTKHFKKHHPMIRTSFIFFLILCIYSFDTFSQAIKSKNLDKALRELNIKPADCYSELVVEKIIPYLPDKSVLVIPKIIEKREDSFSFDSYILIIDNHSGKIISKFYEREAWFSGAAILTSISIDFAPYILSSNTRAFGIRLSYRGDSHVSPFSDQEISLFIPKDSSLVRVLKDYPIYTFHENPDFDGCINYSSTTENKVIIITDSLTNNFYDILIKNKITSTRMVLINNDCKDKDSIFVKKDVLRFDNNVYRSK
jgi:hypothetical protein